MRAFIFLILAVLLALPPGSARAQEVSNRGLLEGFELVAFGREYQPGEKDKLIRWNGPIKVALVGKDVPLEFENMIVDHLRDLSLETGLAINLAYSERLRAEHRLPKSYRESPFNLLLIWAPEAQLPATVEKLTKGVFKAAGEAKLLKESKCHGRALNRKKSGVLYFAYAAFTAELATRTDYDGKKVDPHKFMLTCVNEELTQLLGLPNDVSGLSWSLFNDDNRVLVLSDPDRWLLRILYDPRMKPGMKRADALKMAAKILAERRPGK